MRIVSIAMALVGLSGCFGKLLDPPGSANLAEACAPDGGVEAALVGTWSCSLTSDSSQPNNPGSHGSPVNFTEIVNVLPGEDGKVTVNLQLISTLPGDKSCTGLRFSVSGATATMDAPQSCAGETAEEGGFTAGSFELSSCGAASLSLADQGVPPGAPSEDYTVSTSSGSCTRQ